MTKHDSTAPSILDKSAVVKKDSTGKIMVTVHIPEQLQERVRQQKINQIYDILKPDMSR